MKYRFHFSKFIYFRSTNLQRHKVGGSKNFFSFLFLRTEVEIYKIVARSKCALLDVTACVSDGSVGGWVGVQKKMESKEER